VEALVNTVNEIGVMGKGIALMFRNTFPDNAREYEDAAKAGKVRVGQVLVTKNTALLGPRWIIHFPTKKHWRSPSQFAWIRDGLKDLVRVVRKHGIQSIALPPLGCGNGGLEWSKVRQQIEVTAAAIPEVDFLVFAPMDSS
jgi:O-acetyl-ADP-ribose deacetylase (regulator of RNase III)